MTNKLLLGMWRMVLPVPGSVWKGVVSRSEKDTIARLVFMDREHHLVRDFVVRELPHSGEPLSPEAIAEGTGLPLAQVPPILDRLEKEMTFLFRGDGRNVTWAYPVTVNRTPHHVRFSTGEEVYAA